jgi:multidrug efflux pump subunit AcrA (membrane-fusion protein)
LEAAKLAYDQAKTNKSLGLNKKRYQLDSLRESRQRSDEEHDKLVADRGTMKLRAPIDGVVYYGRCQDGKFTEIDNLKDKLVPFGSIAANTVVMTVTHSGQMNVETSVAESDFSKLKTGVPAAITLVADEDVELSGLVEAIDAVPQASNKFGVTLNVDASKAPKWLAPGMTCKTKLTVYEVEDAVVIPGDLLQTDEDDEDVKYVMVLGEDGKQARRNLKLGEEDGDDVEVLEGLDEGDQIVKGAKVNDEENDEDGDDE